MSTPTTPPIPSSSFIPATVVLLILIAIAMVVVLGAMLYGSHLARRRHRAQEIEEQRAEQVLAESPPPPSVDENGVPCAPFDNDAAATASSAPADSTEKAAATPALQEAPAPAPRAGLPLTTIKGLGPKVAAMLAELGVTGVDQIAALSPAEADTLDAKLGSFAGRMTRDRWIEQARLLTAGDRAAYEAEFGKLG